MIPVIDDYLQALILKRLRFLKDNPILIDYIFQTSRSETIQRLKELLTTQKLRVMIGFPREQTSLPAYIITLAPEQEQPSGLGDNLFMYDDEEDEEDDVKTSTDIYLNKFLASTFMNATYRIECWSDNGDLTAYMYSILKWCLWTCRKDMLEMGWNNIVISGSDLEPVPDYMPIFIYRRASQISLTYDAKYHETLDSLEKFLKIVSNPELYIKNTEGNITDDTGNTILSKNTRLNINSNSY